MGAERGKRELRKGLYFELYSPDFLRILTYGECHGVPSVEG